MDIAKAIARGVKHHAFFDDRDFVSDEEALSLAWDRSRLALAIYTEALGTEVALEKDVHFYRAFLVECGFTPEFAKKVVSSEESPLGVY